MYKDRAEFSRKKAEDLKKAVNEALSVLNAGVTSNRQMFCKEDIQPLGLVLEQTHAYIGELLDILRRYFENLPSSLLQQQSTKQLHSIVVNSTFRGGLLEQSPRKPQ